MVFACAALFVAGMIMAFPMVEVAIISVVIAAVGVSAYALNIKHSLAKDIGMFKHSVDKIISKQEAPNLFLLAEDEAEGEGELRSPKSHD